jgi:hypothetical protein
VEAAVQLTECGGLDTLEVPSIDDKQVEEAWARVWDQTWAAVEGQSPHQCENGVVYATHASWMAPEERDADPESLDYDKWYKPGMPEYVRFTHRVADSHVRDFMRFRCGSHKLLVCTGRWQGQPVPRAERMCLKCTHNEVEDELHFLLRCPAYDPLRREAQGRCGLFDCCGGLSGARRAGDAGMRMFMNQAPRHVARFVSECMQLREVLPDLLRYSEFVDLFSSDDET